MSAGIRTAKAFTLIELLVVIAIVALLAGMVIGATNTVRAAAQSSRCTSDLRQAVLALTAYSTDWEGRLMGAVGMSGFGSDTWTRTLVNTGFHDGSDNIFVCPSIPPKRYQSASPSRVRGLRTPHVTLAITPPGALNSLYRETVLVRVPSPSSYVLVADTIKTVYTDGLANPAQVYNLTAYDTYVPPEPLTVGVFPAHRGRITVAMVDGSTTTLSPAQAGDASLPSSSRFPVVTMP